MLLDILRADHAPALPRALVAQDLRRLQAGASGDELQSKNWTGSSKPDQLAGLELQLRHAAKALARRRQVNRGDPRLAATEAHQPHPVQQKRAHHRAPGQAFRRADAGLARRLRREAVVARQVRGQMHQFMFGAYAASAMLGAFRPRNAGRDAHGPARSQGGALVRSVRDEDHGARNPPDTPFSQRQHTRRVQPLSEQVAAPFDRFRQF